MLKEFINYLLDLKRPESFEAGGKKFVTDREFVRIDKESDVEALNVRSLSGIVEYVQSQFDTDRKFMVHVESPTKVFVYDALNKDNDRRKYLAAKAMLPTIHFERFVDREAFQIMLTACFVDNSDKAFAIKVVSNIVEDQSVTKTDDGLSQRVVAKTGVASVGNIEIPKTLNLKPFRTFAEVPQPESSFLLRLKEGGAAALFEADGGAWELNAMANIADYLEKALEKEIEAGKVIVID